LFSQLERKFPSNLHLLLHIAKLQFDTMELEDSLYTFKKARVADEFNLSMMDLYASVLQQRGTGLELNRQKHNSAP
jgi:hypothetical protein